MSSKENAVPQKAIPIEIAPGELIDKITILEIKLAQIRELPKREHVRYELALLTRAHCEYVSDSPELAVLREELKTANQSLWDIEDALRLCERNQDFGDQFVQLARSVYHTNDQRARLKRKINELLGSELLEVKHYPHYES